MERNLCRRKVKEAFRQAQKDAVPGLNYYLFVRRAALEMPFLEITKAVQFLFASLRHKGLGK